MPRSAAQRQRPAVRGVQPGGDPGEVRGRAAVHQRGGVRVALGQRGVRLAGQRVELLADLGRALQRVGVAGNRALQPGEGVERDGHGHDDEDDPAHLAHPGRVPAQRADPARELAARHGDREQRHRGADGERGGEDDRGQAHPVGGPDHGDRGQDRPGARHVQHAEGQAEHEPSGLAARPAGAHPRERALEQRAQRRDEVAEPDQDQQRHALRRAASPAAGGAATGSPIPPGPAG